MAIFDYSPLWKTMQEKGVSRLIELDVSQIESKLGMKAAEQ